MVRTKKTAEILRQLQIPVSDRDSSSEDKTSDLALNATATSANENLSMDVGLPNAQRTDEVEAEGITQASEDQLGAEDEAHNSLRNETDDPSDDDGGNHNDGGNQNDKSIHACASATSRDSFLTRKRALSAEDNEMHHVAAVKQYHKSWEDLNGYLKEYQKDTHTVIAISETMNVRLRNAQIAKMKSNTDRALSKIEFVPAAMDPYQRVYICTHDWKPRSRSKGQRPRHKFNGVGCPMRFRAQCVLRSTGEWCIQVKQAYYGHNHLPEPEVYEKYASVRQVPKNAPIMSDVELMVASGSKASRIYDYIRQSSPHSVQLKDVHNLIAKTKSAGS